MTVLPGCVVQRGKFSVKQEARLAAGPIQWQPQLAAW